MRRQVAWYGAPRMNYKLFFSTFLLIFLAELGDKTQLAAMARAATGEHARWYVFFAASSALVLSTLIAVLFGSALQRLVPVIWIKTAAGVLFLLFGLLILINAFAPEKAGVVKAKAGLLPQVVLRAAATFEESAVQDYTQLAAAAGDSATRELMRRLAAEEAEHLGRIRGTGMARGEPVLVERLPATLPPTEDLMHDAARADSPLRHAIEHEEATAKFYEELARVSAWPAMKETFSLLAQQEREHRRRLEAFLRDRA